MRKRTPSQQDGSTMMIAMVLIITLVVLAALPALISTGESTTQALSTLDQVMEDPSGAGGDPDPEPAPTSTPPPPAATNTPVPAPTNTAAPTPTPLCPEGCDAAINHHTGEVTCLCY